MKGKERSVVSGPLPIMMVMAITLSSIVYRRVCPSFRAYEHGQPSDRFVRNGVDRSAERGTVTGLLGLVRNSVCFGRKARYVVTAQHSVPISVSMACYVFISCSIYWLPNKRPSE